MGYADPTSERSKQLNREKTARWRANHPDYKPSEGSVASKREKQRVQGRKYRQSVRLRVLAAYGGKCACCGEGEPNFLAIDHVHGGGTAHRKEVGIGFAMYKWLIREGCPQDGRFRLLCHNCNCARGYYGVCPHEVAREAVA